MNFNADDYLSEVLLAEATFSVGLAGTLTRQELKAGTPSVIDDLGKVVELMGLSETI